MAISNEKALAFLKKNPIGISCFVLSVAIVAALYFRSDKVPNATVLLDDRNRENRILSSNIANSAQLKEQHETLATANQAIASRLINTQDRFVNLGYFSELEKAAGVTFLSSDQGLAGAPKNGFVAVPFKLTAQGTYEQLMDFLRRLEYGDHYCRIATSTIARGSSERPDLLILSLSVELLGRP